MPGQAQNGDNRARDKDVQILNRDRNLPKLAVFSAGYKQNVRTSTQGPSSVSNRYIADSGLAKEGKIY